MFAETLQPRPPVIGPQETLCLHSVLSSTGTRHVLQLAKSIPCQQHMVHWTRGPLSLSLIILQDDFSKQHLSLLLKPLVILNLLAFRLLLFQEIDYGSVTQTVIQEIVTDKYHKNNTLTVFYWDIVQSQVQETPTKIVILTCIQLSPTGFVLSKCFLIQFECCGYSGPIDWAYSSYNGYQDITKEIGIGAQAAALPFRIPSSCCRSEHYESVGL